MKPILLTAIAVGVFLPFFEVQGQCTIDSATRVVTGTEHWYNVRNMRGHIQVDSNAALHVYNKLTFREEAYIEVKQGGRLYLHSGARLTHHCSD
ncbi:MAG: hypothetical protein M3Q97_04870 [Bacteroidota bacterium]|nr:hypothetical protein [Bacteroidota bacterium]